MMFSGILSMRSVVDSGQKTGKGRSRMWKFFVSSGAHDKKRKRKREGKKRKRRGKGKKKRKRRRTVPKMWSAAHRWCLIDRVSRAWTVASNTARLQLLHALQWVLDPCLLKCSQAGLLHQPFHNSVRSILPTMFSASSNRVNFSTENRQNLIRVQLLRISWLLLACCICLSLSMVITATYLSEVGPSNILNCWRQE
jgi:hypothetical protein